MNDLSEYKDFDDNVRTRIAVAIYKIRVPFFEAHPIA
jgi:hypothetical protein